MTDLVVMTYWWTDPTSKYGQRYSPADVRRLQRMVKANLPRPHQFVVVTDEPLEFEADLDILPVCMDYTTHVPGTCFVRLFTFSPMAKHLGTRVLQMDLDTVIVGNLEWIVDRPEPLVMWRNPSRLPYHKPDKPGRPFYNTSLLLHRTGTMPWLWAGFTPDAPKHRDDQWYLSDALGPDMPFFDGVNDGVYRLARDDTPGSGVSGELPPNARIVTFPGSEGKHWDPAIRAANPWIAEHLLEHDQLTV